MNDITTSVASPSDYIAMERVEREAWLDMFAAAPSDAASPVHWKRADACGLIADRSLPMSEFNRCMGFGIGAPSTQTDLEQAIQWLDSHASPSWSIQVPPQAADGEIAGWMKHRGLRPGGTGWAKFFRRVESGEEHPAQTDLNVRELSSAESAHFGAVIVGGFGFPASLGPWFSSLVGRRGWRIYLAYAGDVPVGCGALYVDGGWGWMGCDTTLQKYRGRGAQTSLIQRRIADAAEVGIAMVTAETGQPAPGQEQSNRSHLNYLKAGFTKAYVRPNYRRL
jgi:hypothetical protein